MNTEPNDDAAERFSLLEMDSPSLAPPPTRRQPIPVMPPPADPVPPSTATDMLRGIAAEAAANAATQGIGSLAGGQLRGVGFASREGYIQAIRNGVPGRTHAEYLTVLRSRFGMTSADIAALNLPGPMAAPALPVGDGVRHVAAGPSVFDRPASERRIPVGGAAPEMSTIKPADLSPEKLVGVASAEGHGVVIAWHGRGSIARGALQKALEERGLADLIPRANGAHAQASRAVQLAKQKGYVVRVERRATIAKHVDYDARWSIGRAVHGAEDDVLARVACTITLRNDELTWSGSDDHIASVIIADYKARIAAESYQSADITSWLGRTLKSKYSAIAFGALGYYIPARHRQAAGHLCLATSGTGFGTGWVLPGLPVTTSEQLCDGLLGGLMDEVADIMERLATERSNAAAERAKATADFDHAPSGRSTRSPSGRLPSGDIGPKRAASFLAELRRVGERVVAYETVLGTDRVSAARLEIKTAISDLESVLGEEHAGISARFANVWDEIERDVRKSGGVL